jgi:alanyl-tRNA synthetase
MAELSSTGIGSSAKSLRGAKLYVARNPPMGEEQIIAQGQKSVSSDPSLIYLALFPAGKSARMVCFVGSSAKEAGYSASDIVRKLAPILGGSGGGSPLFAQGGGPHVDRIDEAASLAESLEPPAQS